MRVLDDIMGRLLATDAKGSSEEGIYSLKRNMFELNSSFKVYHIYAHGHADTRIYTHIFNESISNQTYNADGKSWISL